MSVVFFRDYEHRGRSADVGRDPVGSALIIILPTVRVERYLAPPKVGPLIRVEPPADCARY